ncbi:MAG: flavodoxin-dependent (E)-4-hydroxy-3-methylbut-2-enyl-diphosphate synthase [Candidatus Omnitrophica bacterium]|nr:flavodoxin-dependent (E)-4-hydroxy-3-methylbut-2-enyl-diphosphate synthase [Candidatus Omnitrophota bacterium]
MKITRRKARVVKVSKVYIGGSHPIAIQSMAKTRTADIDGTVAQIRRLQDAGCEIVRVAVKDEPDALAIKEIRKNISLPLVADIHFSFRLAIKAIESGADKIRLNPGNIYKDSEIKSVISALKEARIPLRIGVNSGSLRGLSLVSSCLDYIKKIEKLNFFDIVISLKGSTVRDTVEAYRSIAKKCEYPLHLGLTATGLPRQGTIKSSIALGILLSEGMGDTLRVSLTDDPVQEVLVARAILESLALRNFGHEIISCPTCGRCEVDLVSVVNDLENKLSTVAFQPSTRPLKVAVMGCVVNGPGEAKQADIGIAFGKNEGLLFKRGKSIRKVPFVNCSGVLLEELRKI